MRGLNCAKGQTESTHVSSTWKSVLQSNAKYAMKRVVITTFTKPTVLLSHSQDNIFLSQTPTRVVIRLLSSASFNWIYKNNPFNSQTYELNYLSLSVDGKLVTGKPLTTDYERNQYVWAIFGTNLALGYIGKDAGNFTTYGEFRHGYTLYAFDLTPSLLDGNQFELEKSGPLAVELKFSTATSHHVQCLIYVKLDSVIELSKTDKC